MNTKGQAVTKDQGLTFDFIFYRWEPVGLKEQGLYFVWRYKSTAVLVYFIKALLEFFLCESAETCAT